MSEKNTNKYAIVDLEATSASSTASIIQVGIVIMQNGQVIDEFASDVNPLPISSWLKPQISRKLLEPFLN